LLGEMAAIGFRIHSRRPGKLHETTRSTISQIS
jgi:hypothetical protein